MLKHEEKGTTISERRWRGLIFERSIISGLTDLIGDAAKLLSCAVQVVDNLITAVEVAAPILAEIELLRILFRKLVMTCRRRTRNYPTPPRSPLHHPQGSLHRPHPQVRRRAQGAQQSRFVPK